MFNNCFTTPNISGVGGGVYPLYHPLGSPLAVLILERHIVWMKKYRLILYCAKLETDQASKFR